MSDASAPYAPCKLVDLGTDVLIQVVLSLSHVQWTHLAPVCRVFRAVVADARAACAHAEPATLQLTAHVLSRTLGDGLLCRVLGLRSLALRGVAGINDVQLRSLTVLQQLHSLDIASTEVTSRGLRSLSALQCLKDLDVTFCPIVSYGAVLELRRLCPNLQLIRRQPQWLDGHFETPWGEVHTYYPCGAFSFSRDVESEGWTAQLATRGNHIEDRLIFADYPQMPHAIQYNGRIGVLLKQLYSGRDQRPHVLVVQSLSGVEPPREWPPLLPAPAAGSTNYHIIEGLMISTMIVRPLDPGCTQPPADLQARLSRFCEERHANPAGGPGSLVRREAEITALFSMQCPAAGDDPIEIIATLATRFPDVAAHVAPLPDGHGQHGHALRMNSAVFDALVADRLDPTGS